MEQADSLLSDSWIIANTFQIDKKIGSGAFGEIYSGKVIHSGAPVAIKVEVNTAKHPQLAHESRVYKTLAGASGFPRLLYFGADGPVNVLVMELVGPSLEQLFVACGKKFSTKTVCMLGDAMLQRIEFLHCKHYVHRDVKPDNFTMGMKENVAQVYLLDFGLAHRYRDNSTQLHIACTEGKSLTGTARYASVNTHLGLEQSRRDDLESLGYVLVYFLRGELPWQGIKAASRDEKYRLIQERKQKIPLDQLCKGLPQELATFLLYVKELKFDERPDYTYLRRLLKNTLLRSQCVDDKQFDWMQLPTASDSSSRDLDSAVASKQQPQDSATSFIRLIRKGLLKASS